MGTRNSTLVKLNGEIKVAQYGQWDGYPTGQGQTVADFIKSVDLKDFKKKVAAVKPISDEKVHDYWKQCGADNSGFVSMDVADKFKELHPELSRDTGAGILQLIADGKATEVQLDKEFKDDGLFCEYWYEIDLDNETVTMNGRKFTFKEWTKPNFMKELENEED